MMRDAIGRSGLVLLMLGLGAFAGVAGAKEKRGDHVEAWIGQWTTGPEQEITIARSGEGDLLVEGFASWGAQDPERVERGAVHVGEFAVNVPVAWINRKSRVLTFAVGLDGALRPEDADEYDCVITLERRADALAAQSNVMCGGHNVSFNGIYRRADRSEPARP